MFRCIVCLGLLGALLVASVPTGAGAHAPANRAYTLQRAQDFINAYNRRDIPGVLATLDFSNPMFFYDDCDYVSGKSTKSYDKTHVIAWLRMRFAEGDHFPHAKAANHNPADNSVAGIDGRRVSDILTARGISLSGQGQNKMGISSDGKFWKTEFVGLDCFGRRFPRHPSTTETRVLATAFVDTYNAHRTDRTLQMLSASVVYSDCNYQSHRAVTLHGQAQVRRWLNARFGNGDRLRRAGNIYATAKTATLALDRSSHSLGHAQSQRMTARVDQYGAALQRVTVSSAGCR